MISRDGYGSRVRRALPYAGALCCFLLPFVNISCRYSEEDTMQLFAEGNGNDDWRSLARAKGLQDNPQLLVTASGVQIILGRISYADPDGAWANMDRQAGNKSRFRATTRALAAGAALALAVGVLFCLWRPATRIVACGAGLGAVVCLAFLTVVETTDAPAIIIVSWGYGWWLAILLSLTGSVVSFLRKKDAESHLSDSNSP